MKTIKEWQEEQLSEIAMAAKPKNVNWDYYYRTFGIQADVDEKVKVPVQIAVERVLDAKPDASPDEIIIDMVNAVVYWVKNMKAKETGGSRLPMQWTSTALKNRFRRDVDRQMTMGGDENEEL
jgi:hypothetical protein